MDILVSALKRVQLLSVCFSVTTVLLQKRFAFHPEGIISNSIAVNQRLCVVLALKQIRNPEEYFVCKRTWLISTNKIILVHLAYLEDAEFGPLFFFHFIKCNSLNAQQTKTESEISNYLNFINKIPRRKKKGSAFMFLFRNKFIFRYRFWF